MEASGVSPEDTSVLSLWEDRLNRRQASISLMEFQRLFLVWSQGFLSVPEDAFSREAWSLLGDHLWSTLSVYGAHGVQFLLQWKRVDSLLGNVFSPRGSAEDLCEKTPSPALETDSESDRRFKFLPQPELSWSPRAGGPGNRAWPAAFQRPGGGRSPTGQTNGHDLASHCFNSY